MDYLGWLLGHEGKGSILYHLKQRYMYIYMYDPSLYTNAKIKAYFKKLFCRKFIKRFVRSGIRTHAYMSRLRPERSALDRSAILTH